LKYLAYSYIASVGDLRGDLQIIVTYQQNKGNMMHRQRSAAGSGDRRHKSQMTKWSTIKKEVEEEGRKIYQQDR
jgi:hypothetical protein